MSRSGHVMALRFSIWSHSKVVQCVRYRLQIVTICVSQTDEMCPEKSRTAAYSFLRSHNKINKIYIGIYIFFNLYRAPAE